MAASPSTAEQALKEGDAQRALKLLTEQVRAKPQDAKLRVFLFQLLCVLGQWERALNQLNVAARTRRRHAADGADLPRGDPCETLRLQVFAGHKAPMLFGEPEAWVALLIEALLRDGRGEARCRRAAARAGARAGAGHRRRARRPAFRMDRRRRHPARPDARGGHQRPLLLAAVEPPVAGRDRPAGRPARRGLDAGALRSSATAARSSALIPTRYPDTDLAAGGAAGAGAARPTGAKRGRGGSRGLGQRLLATDARRLGADGRARRSRSTPSRPDAAPPATTPAHGHRPATPQDRLQPALLDRLTDDDAGSPQPRRVESRVISRSRLRELVLRDLAWLFNTTAPDAAHRLGASAPHARRSVLNYGLPALSGLYGLGDRPAAARRRESGRRSSTTSRASCRPRCWSRRSCRTSSSTTTTRSAFASPASSGRSRCRWSCCCRPTSTSRPAASRCASSSADAPRRAARTTRAMDPRLLRYYNQELRHLREMGAEFAQQFPKIAARLGMEGLEVTDPYVERLLEGFAFLAGARPAEDRRRVPALHAAAARDRLSALPGADAVDADRARARPSSGDPALAAGLTLPRGSGLHGQPGKAGRHRMRVPHRARRCTLWPLELHAGRVLHATPPTCRSPRCPNGAATARGLRIRAAHHRRARLLAARARRPAAALQRASTTSPTGCTKLLGGHRAGRPGCRRRGAADRLARGAGRANASSRSASTTTRRCCRATLRGFAGYRLLQEYFAFPQRFLFFDLRRHRRRAARATAAARSTSSCCSRAATPRCSRRSTPAAWRCTACRRSTCSSAAATASTSTRTRSRVPRRPRPHAADGLRGPCGHRGARATAVGADSERRFLPFYNAFHTEAAAASRRTTRCSANRALMSQRAAARRAAHVATSAPRSSCRWSMPREAPLSGRACASSASRALCTNRDLPLLMPVGDAARRPDAGADRAGAEHPASSRGRRGRLSALREASLAWKLINQLSLNHLSLHRQPTPSRAPRRCARSCALYAPAGDAAAQRQVDGLRSVRLEAGGAAAADARADHLRPRRRGRASRSTTWRSKAPAPSCSARARALRRAPRLDQRLHRRLRLHSPARGEILMAGRDAAAGRSCERSRRCRPTTRARRGRRDPLLDAPPRRWATTSSRRCGGSTRSTPTSRAWARRAAPADEPVRLGQAPT